MPPAADQAEVSWRANLRGTLGRYPLVLPAVGLALGLLWPRAAFATVREPLAVVALTLVLGLILARRGRFAAATLAGLLGLFALGGLVGLPLVAPPAAGSVAWLARRYPGPATVVGEIVMPPTTAPGHASLVVRVDRVRVRGVTDPSAGRLAVAVHGLPRDGRPIVPWQAGDWVELTGTLGVPRDFATPGVSSRVDWLARRGIRATLTVKDPAAVSVLRSAVPSPLSRMRAHVIEAVDRYVAGGRRPSRDAEDGWPVAELSDAAAILSAMTVNDRGLLDDETHIALARAGLLHLLAISGFHVGLVAGLAAGVGWLLRASSGLCTASALAAVWLYTLLAGAPTPALRAAIVASVLLAGRLIRREAPAMNSLALAFLVAAVLEPGGLRDAGFQLTFAASAGLFTLPPRSVPAWGPRWLWRSLGASCAAELAVLPIAVYHFGRVAFLGPILNLLAVPLSGLILVAGFALVVAAAIHPAIAVVVGRVAGWSVSLLFVIAEPGIVPWSHRVAAPPLALVLAATAALVAVGSGWPRRRVVRLAPAVVASLGLLVPWSSLGRPDPGSLVLHVLDVGQGDALVVELPGGETIVMDAGGSANSRFDVGDRVVVPFLLARGRRHIQLVAVSHGHPDHAAGIDAVLRELTVDALWLGDEPVGEPLIAGLERRARERGVEIITARRGRVTEFAAEVTVAVLHPEAGRPPPIEIQNSRSLVLAVAAPAGRFLLTGDIHADAEAELVAAGVDLGAGILKVAHHGSRTSSSDEFLAAVRPRLALISCGYQNRFEHPDAEVVARLTASGVRFLRTDLDGTISVTLGADGRLRLATARARFGPQASTD